MQILSNPTTTPPIGSAAAPSGPVYPSLDRYTVATLPVNAPANQWAIVTDGSATPSQVGIAPVGGGSLENVVWSDGRGNWLVV